MRQSRDYIIGGALSACIHGAIFGLLAYQGFADLSDFGRPIVYSVTLDGGGTVGAIAQTPKDNKKSPIAPPKKVEAKSSKSAIPEVKQNKVEKVREVAPKKESDAEVSLAKPTPAPKPTPKPQPSPKPMPKEKPKPKSTPAPPAPKKAEKLSLGEINERLQQAVQRYTGESTDAGGQGFGSAGGSGSGLGGGVVRPPEFFQYQKLLETFVKSGWRWHDQSASLTARVCFSIDSRGTLSDIRLCGSSGNGSYDSSIIRAVEKANPVPPPPIAVMEYFREVRMTFTPSGY